MNALELFVETTKNSIRAGYPDEKAAHVLVGASEKVDELKANLNKDNDDRVEQPQNNILSKLIEDMNNENRETGFSVSNEDETSLANPYVQPEKSDDDDLEL